MTYAFTHMGDFLLLLLLRPPPSNPSLEALNPSLEAQIPALRPKTQPQGPNPSYEAQSQEEETAPLGPLPCSPLNFKHNLLRQGTGTADHLTLLRLFLSVGPSVASVCHSLLFWAFRVSFDITAKDIRAIINTKEEGTVQLNRL